MLVSLPLTTWFLLSTRELEASAAGPGVSTWQYQRIVKREISQRIPTGGASGLLHSPVSSSTPRLLPLSPDKDSPSPVQINCFIDCVHTDAFRKERGRGRIATPPRAALVLSSTDKAGSDARNPPPKPELSLQNDNKRTPPELPHRVHPSLPSRPPCPPACPPPRPP